MEYTTLADTGMVVSKICLGCMSFGDPDWRDWLLDDAVQRGKVRYLGASSMWAHEEIDAKTYLNIIFKYPYRN